MNEIHVDIIPSINGWTLPPHRATINDRWVQDYLEAASLQYERKIASLRDEIQILNKKLNEAEDKIAKMSRFSSRFRRASY